MRCLRSPRTALVALLVVGSAGGCREGLTPAEFDVLRSWLICDECLDRERQAVEAMGARAIPLLVEAFDSLPGGRRENLRRQYQELYGLLSAPTVSEGSFTDRYLDAFDLTVRQRIVISVADIGAWDVLDDLRDQAVQQGYDGGLLAHIDAQRMRDPGALTPGPGPVQAWTVTTPIVQDTTACNGSGAAACTGARTIEVGATAQTGTGAGGPPWTRVLLYARPSGGRGLVLAGEAGAPTVVDPGPERLWTWSVSFTPYGYPVGPVTLIAVGVDAAGTPYATPDHTGVRVVEGR